MMSFLSALGFGLSSVSFPPSEARDKAIACGLMQERVRVMPVRELGSDVLAIASGAPIDVAQAKCLADVAVETSLFVLFDDPAQQASFAPIYLAAERERDEASARKWLAERNLLRAAERLADPTLDPSERARSIESLCGVARGTVLMPVAAGALAFLPEAFFDTAGPRVSSDQLTCLLAVGEASGSPIGFLGNEADESQNRSP